MTQIDVFNGDADGICGLHQLRLTHPVASALVTGVKRDVKLLEQVCAQAGDEVTVLDISMDQNRDALTYLLNLGVNVTYFDHHFAGEPVKHPQLTAIIDSSPDTCTSALVDRYLGGQHRAWAVVAAFGDNLGALAYRLAEPLNIAARDLDRLKELGQCLNYNAYGETVAELFFHPAALYRSLQPYASPLGFVQREAYIVQRLRTARDSDMALARQQTPAVTQPGGSIYVLPDAAWSRRILGDYANWLTDTDPNHAHAVLTRNTNGTYIVSVRAPGVKPRGADELCLHFATGGGRSGAAGISQLPESELEEFSRKFFSVFG
jgi:hypothetical protein